MLRFLRRQRHRLRERARVVQGVALHFVQARPHGADATERDAFAGETLIGVVGAQLQTIFGARREHAVGLADAARHEIVDHHADVGFGAIENDFIAVTGQRGCVETGQKPLRRSLFVTGGAVDLASEKQPAQTFRFQCRLQFARIDAIIFDRVTRTDELGLLQSGNGRDQSVLHVFRQRCRNAVRINGVVVESFRLEKNLMAVAFAEFYDLVFDRRTVTRTATCDLAGIHRRAMHVVANDLVRGGNRARDAAFDLRIGDAFGQHRERFGRIVAGLHLDALPIDGAAVQPRRRAGLQAAEREAGAFERR